MKTNVKNGLVFLGEVDTYTDITRIENITQIEWEYEFTTKLQDWVPVLAETNENGSVTKIIIDVNFRNQNNDNDEVTEIEIEDVLMGTVDGVEVKW